MARALTDDESLVEYARLRATNALSLIDLLERQREQVRLMMGGTYELPPRAESFAKALAQDVLALIEKLEG